MTTLKILLLASFLLFSAPAAFAGDADTGTGTVAETMISGGYVYVRLKEDGTWLASSPVPVAVGNRVSYADGTMMKDFYSRTLDRSFDAILFVTKLDINTKVDVDAPQAGEITPLDGGKTVADVLAEYAQLKDQQVGLRARVMKVSPNILGKNWITLQDGTGTSPHNQLIATSSETVAIGDLVTAKGVIRTNVDLGSGYTYTVLLEKATFSP